MNECKHPIIILDLGINPEDGKHITKCFQKIEGSSAYEYARIQAKKNKAIKTYIFGCGKCPECKRMYALEKSLRCYCESVYSNENYFLTLTFDNKHLPKGPTLKNTCRKILANFIRELKFHCETVRYFGACERGETFGRPHFHTNLFLTKSNLGLYYKDIHLKSRLIDKIWRYGTYDLKPFEPGTAQYTAGYTAGAIKDTIFIAQSRNLGQKYVLEKAHQIILSGTIMVKGKPVPMQRWVFKILEKEGYYLDDIKEDKNKMMQQKLTDKLGCLGQSYDEYLEDQEKHRKLIPIKRKEVDYQ